MPYESIKVHRTRAGLTQQELADRLGVRAATVSDYETRKAVPGGLALQKMAEIFGCTASDIDVTPAQAVA